MKKDFVKNKKIMYGIIALIIVIILFRSGIFQTQSVYSIDVINDKWCPGDCCGFELPLGQSDARIALPSTTTCRGAMVFNLKPGDLLTIPVYIDNVLVHNGLSYTGSMFDDNDPEYSDHKVYEPLIQGYLGCGVHTYSAGYGYHTNTPEMITGTWCIEDSTCVGTCPIACTADAKQCSDGSYVSRVGPDCEFAACPIPTTCNVASDCPKQCTSAICNSGNCEYLVGLPSPPSCPGENYYGELSFFKPYPDCIWSCLTSNIPTCNYDADCELEVSTPNNCQIFYTPSITKITGTCTNHVCNYNKEATTCSETQTFLQDYKWILIIGIGTIILMMLFRRRRR
jgi:hypothetical protein